MPEVVITYKKPETLKILKSLAKYLDFKMSSDKNKKQSSLDDILIPGDKTLNISELENIFTGSGIDAKKLREEAWKRTK
ncbi:MULTISPECIES: hypothetical protein [Mucilaginibacter]|uniref:Uncharacterized protein n=1 Tax=Mucilaginibacter gotjawali TaxID=1550579 RepID=A0A839SIF2_9SPHI|nr:MULTISPECIES: hypothetical protein [Mucilaginibacter]MBB3057073.1 hypothetical protein [Mucilaginibacter gotjawali]MDR3695434.1 hypothetical protein [Mucilaginibacter sp.]